MNDLKKYSDLRVAIPHYWFMTWRGGERVVKALLDIFPKADIYTLFYDRSVCQREIGDHNVYTSVLDFPPLRSRYQKLFPLYPFAIKSLKFRSNYDLIISSESGPIKGLSNPASIPHLCYIHTPMRYCWGFTDDYVRTLPTFIQSIANREFLKLREYDKTTVEGVDRFVANSQNVQRRVKDCYNREASVVYPPISLDLFRVNNLTDVKSSEREYYLSFGAITPYKGVGLLIEAFNRLSDKKLIVIGEGSERNKLQNLANKNIIFTGALGYPEIQKYIRGAKALLFPGEEDFGMIPLEVMAHGVPVIAFARGGALETVVESESGAEIGTGIFFDRQDSEAVIEAILRFDVIQDEFDPSFIQAHARVFGEDNFKINIINEVEVLLSGSLNKPV